MVQPELSAKVETSVSIQPVLSQTFLVSLLGLSAVGLICATFLLEKGLGAGWIFAVLSVVPMGGAIVGWWRSQPDVDSAGAHPTTLIRADGASLTTDIKTIRSPEVLQNLAQLADGILNTQPLPNADGLVNSDMKVIPDSQEKAEAITQQINEETQALTNGLVDALNLTDDAATVAPVLIWNIDKWGQTPLSESQFVRV